MFIIEEGNTVIVYDHEGRLMYKSLAIVQYKKFSENNFVVITEDSVDFVSQVKTKEDYDILVVSDTNFVSAVIVDELVLIQRKLIIPVMDVYDSGFINVLRLYKSLTGKWVHYITRLGLPLRSVVPTYLSGSHLYGFLGKKICVTDLESGKYKIVKKEKKTGIALQSCIEKFQTGAV